MGYIVNVCLSLKNRPPKKQCPTEGFITLSTRATSTTPIDKIKAEIQQRTDIPADEQRLFIELKDDRTLSDYNFSSGADLILHHQKPR